MLRRVSLAMALWSAATLPVWAQVPREIDGFADMPAERFLTISRDRPDGLGVSISWLKFSRVFGEDLKVYDRDFQGLFVVRDAKLKVLLEIKGQDSAGNPLVKRQNIQVVGTGMRQPGGGYVLVVQRVFGLEGDLERYTRRARSLTPADAAGRLALATEIRRRARVSLDATERPPVLQLARSLEEAARKIERRQLPRLPGGAAAWLNYARRYRQIAELEALTHHADVNAELKQQAELLLGKLGARRFLGRWMSESDYQRAVGFVKLGNRWVPQEQVELRQAATDQLELMADPARMGPWPPASDRFLTKAAREGSIVKGQRKKMALAAIQRISGQSQLPLRVDRWRQRVEGQKAARIWERWEMPDGRLLFFMQGRVIKNVGPE